MKTIFSTVGVLIMFALTSFGQNEQPASEGSKIIEKMSFDEIVLSIPEVGKEVERIELDNGLIIYIYLDNSLPQFNISTYVRGGGIFDPVEKDGLSGIVGTVMRSGGTTTISGDSLNNILEFIGGSLESGIGRESGSVSLNVLSKDIELGLELYTDLLLHPEFPEEKIDLAKADIKNNIKRRDDHPGSITGRYYANILYGNHPDGRILEWESVKGITRDDLLAYHNKYFVPENIMIGISGNFDKKIVLDHLKDKLSNWKKSGQPLPDYPEVAYEFKPGVYQIFKDINQANIRLGHLGIKRDNPDRYAINLMNFILGGGSFTSRMTSKVRSDEGLAYSVGSRYSTGSRDYGSFYAYCQTKSETAYKAIDLMVKEIRRIRDEGVSVDELEDAKNSTLNKLVFNFDNASEIVNRLLSLEFNDYAPDYYQTYSANVRNVTIDDIKRVANEYLHPDKISFIVVGNPELYEKPLDDFGTVTNIELSEPVLE